MSLKRDDVLNEASCDDDVFLNVYHDVCDVQLQIQRSLMMS